MNVLDSLSHWKSFSLLSSAEVASSQRFILLMCMYVYCCWCTISAMSPAFSQQPIISDVELHLFLPWFLLMYFSFLYNWYGLLYSIMQQHLSLFFFLCSLGNHCYTLYDISLILHKILGLALYTLFHGFLAITWSSRIFFSACVVYSRYIVMV